MHTYFPRSRSRPWVASRAATLITDGIRLNCINPGPTDTAMLPYFVEFAGQNIIDAFVGPIRRRSTAEEQAWPLIFLNSPRSSYINGGALVTGGGFFGAVQSRQLDLGKMFDTPDISATGACRLLDPSPERSAARRLDEACPPQSCPGAPMVNAYEL